MQNIACGIVLVNAALDSVTEFPQKVEAASEEMREEVEPAMATGHYVLYIRAMAGQQGQMVAAKPPQNIEEELLPPLQEANASLASAQVLPTTPDDAMQAVCQPNTIEVATPAVEQPEADKEGDCGPHVLSFLL